MITVVTQLFFVLLHGVQQAKAELPHAFLVSSGVVHSIHERIPEAKQSEYSSQLPQLLGHWPPQVLPRFHEYDKAVWIRGIKTPGKGTYIGQVKEVVIHAPLSVVSRLISEFEGYVQIFQELKTVKVVERDGDKVTVFWERFSPFFFVPNIKYEQIYIIDRAVENRIIYR